MATDHHRIRFVEIAKTIHSGFYDYSKVLYVSDKTKVEIICPVHGSFWQMPHAHKRGQRCPQCAYQASKMSYEFFIKKARAKHGSRYDYSNVVINGGKTHIEIVCPDHGSFFCSPANHIHKTAPTGCLRCGFLSNKKHSVRRGYKTFVERSNIAFGDRYDYSKVDYKGAHIHVEIICERHGSFWQTPANHYSGHHCAQCAHEDSPASLGENKIRDWLIERKVEFQREKTFDDLRNPQTNRLLRYDFYLPAQNLLIEFDGEHHFEPVRGDVDHFIRIQERDSIKTAYAADHGIKLIRVSDKTHISTILENALSDCSLD